MKRKAFHSLEREKFLKGIDCFNDPHTSREFINSSITSDTPEQIAQRRVVRLKLPSEILAARMEAIEKKTSSLTMEAPETITQAQTTQNTLPPPSFFNRPMIPVPAGQTEETSKAETQTSSSDQNRLVDESRTQENGFKAAEETKAQSSLFGGLISQPVQQGFTSNILSEDNKPKVSLFGTTTTQGFGANLGSDNKPQTGLFGSSISKPITQEAEVNQPETKPRLFGSQTPALQGFGENKPQTGIFGNLSQQPKPQEENAVPAQTTEQPKSTLFGGLTTSKPGLFGSQTPAPQGFGFSQPTENKSSTGLFGSLSQQPKPQESIVAQPQVPEQPKSNLFGGLASTTPVLGLGSAATLDDNKPKTGLFGAPTQPSTGFGFAQAAETKPQTGIFGNLPQQPKPQEETAVPAQTTEQPKSTLFGGLTTSKPGLFGSQTPAPQGFSFSQPTENKPSTGLFGSLPQQPKTQEPVISQPQISEQPKPNLFGGLVQKPAVQEPAQETAPKLGLFGSSSSSFAPATQKSEPQPTSTPIEDTNKPKPGLFGSLSQTVKPQGLGFGQTEGTQPKSGFISVMPQLPKAPEPVITQPQTSEQPKPNLFGGLGQKPVQQDTGTQKPALFGGLTQVVTPPSQTQGFTMSQPAENKPSLGLFGASSQQPKPQESSVTQPKPAEQPKTNFFGSTTQTPGLFGAQPSASTGLGLTQAGENKPQSGFFGSFSQKPAALTPSAEETKKESKPVQEEPKTPAVQDTGAPKSSIFSTLLHKTAQEEGLEPETKPEPEKKPLFGNLLSQKPAGTEAPPATGLFGQILGTKPAEPAKTGGLFSSTPAPATSSLFSGDNKSSSDKDNKPEGESKPGLFAAGAKSGGKPLFASLMSKPPTTFTSALSSQPVNPLNMFTKPPKGDDEGSEGEGDDGEDEEPVRTPSPEADVTKSKGNYQYQFDYDKIISKKVNKLKPGAKDMLLEGEVSLNKNKEGQIYFIIYRNKAKIAQYQGQLVPKVSKTEFLNPRQDALSVIAYSTDKGAEGEKPKMNKDVIKIMFGTPDDCNAFKKEVDKILS